MNIEIRRMEPCWFEEAKSTIIARFDARVGDFSLRRATLRRRHDGVIFIGTGGGKGRSCFSLPDGTPTRHALLTAAMEAYECLKHH